MIEIQGYWIINGIQSEFKQSPALIHQQDINEYRSALSDIHGLEVALKYRTIPDKIKDLIVLEFMEKQPTLKNLAEKYGVSEYTVNCAIKKYLTSNKK